MVYTYTYSTDWHMIIWKLCLNGGGWSRDAASQEIQTICAPSRSMLSSMTAKCLRSSHIAHRYMSAHTTPKYPSHKALTPAKMRALISLYHQAETFITPENLSERIDEAFLSEKPYGDLSTATTVRDLDTTLAARRAAPKLSQSSDKAASSFSHFGDSWSTKRSQREEKVIETLYGVDLSRPGAVLPSFEVLQDAKEDLERSLKEDLQEALAENRSYTEPTEKA